MGVHINHKNTGLLIWQCITHFMSAEEEGFIIEAN